MGFVFKFIAVVASRWHRLSLWLYLGTCPVWVLKGKKCPSDPHLKYAQSSVHLKCVIQVFSTSSEFTQRYDLGALQLRPFMDADPELGHRHGFPVQVKVRPYTFVISCLKWNRCVTFV